MSKSNSNRIVSVCLIVSGNIWLTQALAQPLPDCCETTSPCAGDANQDGAVDPLDGGFILARFGDDPTVSNNCRADVNCDGYIDPMDVGFAMDRFSLCEEPIPCAPGGGECDEIQDFCNEATPVVVKLGQTISYSGTTTGATPDCTGAGEVWEAFELTVPATVTIDYCGTPTEGDNLFIVIMESCGDSGECGDLIFYNGDVTTADCGDGSFATEITFGGLSPGIYYIPILGAADGGIDGDYGIRVTAAGPDTSNDCCPDDEIPGCQDPEILECVCDFDPVCCITWDEACSILVEPLGCGDCDEQAPCKDDVPPNDNCECVTPVAIADNEIVEFTGDTTGATLDCSPLGEVEVWLAWTHAPTDTIRIDYCGTDTDFDFFYIVADNNCACDGTFIFGTNFTATCDDATTTAGVRFNSLAAGIYYYPVLSGAAGVDGPYNIRIRRNNVN